MMKIPLVAFGLMTTAALLAATALLISDPAGATATRSDAEPAIGSVAFVRGGQGDSLKLIHANPADGNGGELASVTPPGTSVWEYAWSPAARRIAYIDANDGSLWLTWPVGGGRKQLLAGTTLASVDLSWSPDGKKIAVISSGPSGKGSLKSCSGLKIIIVPINGRPPRKLRGTDSSCDGIAWSPRGNEIAYGDRGVWVIHPDGSGRRRVSRHGGMWLRWSADGKQIAFGRTLPLPGFYRGIGVVNADGSHLHMVTRNADSEYPAVWSPEGHQLLYGRANNRGIYVIDANGKNDHRVTTDSPRGGEAPKLAWSPDGRWIVYANSTGGLSEVGVNGGGKVQLTSPTNSDQDPLWITGVDWG